MNKKTVLDIIAVLALVVLGFILYRNHHMATRSTADLSLPVPAATTPSSTNPAAAPVYTWQLTQVEANPSDNIPKTAVVLSVDGTLHPIGMYQGMCKVLEAGDNGVLGTAADANELTRVQCYYAGSGDEIGVFTENGSTVVKAGELSEGSDGAAPFRGNFKTVATL